MALRWGADQGCDADDIDLPPDVGDACHAHSCVRPDGRVRVQVFGLTVDDLQKSITSYEALGFVVDQQWEEGA